MFITAKLHGAVCLQVPVILTLFADFFQIFVGTSLKKIASPTGVKIICKLLAFNSLTPHVFMQCKIKKNV
jgi:hypothetical protein